MDPKTECIVIYQGDQTILYASNMKFALSGRKWYNRCVPDNNIGLGVVERLAEEAGGLSRRVDAEDRIRREAISAKEAGR
jgi:hypothetical protein